MLVEANLLELEKLVAFEEVPVDQAEEFELYTADLEMPESLMVDCYY